MKRKFRVVHALNQFFGGLGGEDAAGLVPQFFEGARGPGLLWQQLATDFEVLGTVVFGDNYAAENPDAAINEMLSLIERNFPGETGGRPDLVVAGPAFQSGRYGMTCGALCKAVLERWNVPGVTGMSLDNPATAEFRRFTIIAETSNNVLGMNEAIEKMVHVARRLIAGEEIDPRRDGTVPQGRRRNYFAGESGAERALTMLLRKLNGEPYETEYAMPEFDRVAPAPPVPAVAKTRVALVTSGGIVPRGNPDRIESASASKFGAYNLAGLDALTSRSHQTVHGGYDPTFANADPNRVLPLDAARGLEAEGLIGALHDCYYATVGNATSVERAREFGKNMAEHLVADGVQAVILTST